MAFTEQREDALFVIFGEEKLKPEKTNSFVVKQGEYLEGTILQIKDSPTYKKIYYLQKDGLKSKLIILGNTALNDKMGYGNSLVQPVKDGDRVRIHYLGMIKTSKGKNAYNIKVEVDRS